MMSDEVIDNNLRETAKVITEPKYIMSAATAWFRKYEDKNMRNLQEKLNELEIPVKLTCELYTKKADFDLCIPGFHSKPLDLKYLVSFVLNPTQISKIVQTEDDLKKLEHAGYTCAKDYDANAATKQRPRFEQLNQEGDIYTQLQWGAIKSVVSTIQVEPEALMMQDIERQGRQCYRRPIIWRRRTHEIIYSYFNSSDEQITEFGELQRLDEYNNVIECRVVYLPNYLHNTDTAESPYAVVHSP